MQYNIIQPKPSKLLQRLPIIFIFGAVFFSFLTSTVFSFIKYWSELSLKKFLVLFAFHAALFIIVSILILILDKINSKLNSFFLNRIKSFISIESKGIVHKFPLFIKKFSFSSIKKIEILDEKSCPRILPLFFQTKGLCGIKITSKNLSFISKFYIFNIDNFDAFLEELRTKAPFHLLKLISKTS